MAASFAANSGDANDARGVARVYEMTFVDEVRKLERSAAAPDFSQRFTGTVDAGDQTIVRASAR